MPIQRFQELTNIPHVILVKSARNRTYGAALDAGMEVPEQVRNGKAARVKCDIEYEYGVPIVKGFVFLDKDSGVIREVSQ